MNSEQLLYLAPYLISLGVSLGIFLYSWQHRNVKGARAYLWYVAGQLLSTMGFIFETISPNLSVKIFWDKFQWLTEGFIIIFAFLVFVFQFTEAKQRNPKLFWAIMLIIPLAFNLIVATDGAHHLIYENAHLEMSRPYSQLTYNFTPAVYLFSLYIYGAPLYGMLLLLRFAFKKQDIYRWQAVTITLGFLIPLGFSLLALFNIIFTPQRDATPITFAIGNMVVMWGLFRFGTLEVVPIARERVIENLNDPVFVLDTNNRIIDVNPAALEFVEKEMRHVIGAPCEKIFQGWTEMREILQQTGEQTEELRKHTSDDVIFYEVNLSNIFNNLHEVIGRTLVIHDITRIKTLEVSYRILSSELEKRVQERTEELRESAERYRAVVQNQTEFIVRWKPNGSRVFVNEAYCRYFDITPEQAYGTNFMPLIVEEDRSAVEQKIIRLLSGDVNAETDIHRVIRPDGSIGWQEWTDQVLYDETGKPIEIQSVGRDVTERKLAEETILKQLAFDELMTRLLANFATCSYDEANSNIDSALREIAEFMDGDFAAILLLSEDGKSWKFLRHWESPQRTLPKRPAESIPTEALTWTENKILQGESIRINSLDDYPPEAVADRKFGESEGIKSLLSVPIRGKAQSIAGAVDIVSYTHHVTWTESDVTHLKLIGDAIANLLERKRAEEDLAEAYDTTLEGWAKALELRDKETEGHSRRVTEITLAVARAAGIPEKEIEHIRRGAILHDIGKMGIPDEILRKNGPLTEEDRVIVNKHPITAYNLLKPIAFLKKALDIPYCHHEKWDGSGYPRGMKGEQIPLAARIFAVADVWDALSYDRPYNQAWSREKIISYLIEQSGKHFDPTIVRLFLSMVEKGEI